MNDPTKLMLISYTTLRRLVGLLGAALPVLLLAEGWLLCGCAGILPSISAYYDLRTRDVLVGILFAIASFLFTYRGYERRDHVAAKLGSTFLILVAVFPYNGGAWQKYLHFGAALALFLVLSYFALFLFTKSDGVPTPEKRVRNRIYVGCGVTILLCVLLIVLAEWLSWGMTAAAWTPVFWLESVALWAFALSWFVKGETLWRDKGRRAVAPGAASPGGA